MARRGSAEGLRIITPAAYVGGWVLFAAMFATQTLISERIAGRRPPLFGVLSYHTAEALFWALATLCLHAMLRSARKHATGRRAALWLATVLVVVVTSGLWIGAVGWAIGGPGPRGPLLLAMTNALRTTFAYNVLLSVTLSAASLGVLAAQDAHQRALDAEIAERALVSVRLELLTQQLQPHFLFNALNTIAGLTHSQPDLADALIGHLSALLRAALRASATPVVTVSEELHLLQHFQTIAMLRYGERLNVTVDVEPAAALGTLPVLLLQPLLENAIDHGVGRRAGPASIWIRVSLRDGRLLVTIADDGVGLTQPDAPAERHGVGLRNARLRLATLYPKGASLELRAREGGGAEVIVDIPFRPGSVAAPERVQGLDAAAAMQVA